MTAQLEIWSGGAEWEPWETGNPVSSKVERVYFNVLIHLLQQPHWRSILPLFAENEICKNPPMCYRVHAVNYCCVLTQ